MGFIANLVNANVEDWIEESDSKLSLFDVFRKFYIDVEQNPLAGALFYMNFSGKIVFDEMLLNNLGYTGAFNYKNYELRRFLKGCENVKFDNFFDGTRRYVMMSALDFENVLPQMRNSFTVRALLDAIKILMGKYRAYEFLRENYIENQKHSAEAILIRNQLSRAVDILKGDMALDVMPLPNLGETHTLGLYRTKNHNEWYLMKRQLGSWDEAEKKLLARNMVFVHKWVNVSHAVGVGNIIKLVCRDSLFWKACSNTIAVSDKITVTDDQMVKALDTAVTSIKNNIDHT